MTYHREQNDYANARYKDIALDLGIGISVINKLRRDIPYTHDVKHVLSDIAFIVYAYNNYVSMKELHKYLNQLALTERKHEAYFKRFMGFKLDKEARTLYDTLVTQQSVVL